MNNNESKTINNDSGLTCAATADLLCVCEATLRTWVKQGKITAIRPGGRKMIFSRSIVDKFLNGKK